jgi:hypothetical protein
MGEHFGNTVSTAAWGRAGISASDWDKVIQLRQDAIRNIGFAGFLAYGWGSNTMKIPEAEQIEHEYYYRSRLVLPGQQPQWLSDDVINVNGTSIPLSWNQPLNWIGGVPNGTSAIANFYRTNTAPRTITLDGPQTVGTLTFDSPFSYTITSGNAGSLTIDGSISVSSGQHTITAPVNIAGVAANVTIDPPESKLTLTDGVTGAQINKLGAGTLEVKSFRNPLIIHAGRVVVTPDGGPEGTSSTYGVGIDSGGQLDLTNNRLIEHAFPVGTWNAAAYNGVTGQVQSGRNGGTWNGSGIITSSAAPGSNLTTLGVASASDVLGIGSSGTATWSGQTVHGTDTLVMYTWGGDANMDGKINIDDYGLIDSHVGQSGTAFGWHNGDFNYDGKINIDDYGIIDANIGAQGAPIPTSATAPELGGLTQIVGVTSVPEPASLGLLGFVGAAPMLRRRSRANLRK